MSNFLLAFKKVYLIILYSSASLEAAYSMLTLHFALVNLMTHHLVYSQVMLCASWLHILVILLPLLYNAQSDCSEIFALL